MELSVHWPDALPVANSFPALQGGAPLRYKAEEPAPSLVSVVIASPIFGLHGHVAGMTKCLRRRIECCYLPTKGDTLTSFPLPNSMPPKAPSLPEIGLIRNPSAGLCQRSWGRLQRPVTSGVDKGIHLARFKPSFHPGKLESFGPLSWLKDQPILSPSQSEGVFSRYRTVLENRKKKSTEGSKEEKGRKEGKRRKVKGREGGRKKKKSAEGSKEEEGRKEGKRKVQKEAKKKKEGKRRKL
ncbi:Pxr1, partial [Ophiophagus hannah]